MTRRSGIYYAGVVLLATSFCCQAFDRAHDELSRGKELLTSGRLTDAYLALKKASAEYPENRELNEAASAARERYANYLLRRAENALAEEHFVEASVMFRRLAMLPGFEAKGLNGLKHMEQQRPLVLSPANSLNMSAFSEQTLAGESNEGRFVENQRPSLPSGSVAAATGQNRMGPKNAETQPAAPVNKDDPMQRRISLELRDAPVRSLFDALTKVSGLSVIFDRDVPPELRTTIYLRNGTVRAAIEKIVLTSGLAWRMLDENTLLVYVDEAIKQHDYQALTIRSFQLANADAKFVANSLKTVLKFRDLVVDEKLNMIVVRDTSDALSMAEKLIAMHDVAEPEVMLEVTVLEISQGKLQSLGIAWPGSMALTPLARTASGDMTTTTTSTATVTTNTQGQLTLRDLYNLTPSSLLMGLGATTLNFNATDSDINVLANPRIRAKSKEKAKILIGERVPNISATATSNGVVSQNISYVDVGLKLDVEPHVLPGNEISLKISLEVSSINSTVENKLNGMVAYRIGTRNTSTVLRLKDGENQVLAGLVQDSDRKSVTKVPLLGDIPILGSLFRSNTDDKGKTEIVLSITPHLIRGNNFFAPGDAHFDAGTHSSVRGRQGDGENNGMGDASVPTPAPSPSPVQERSGTPAL